jgi:hypothetical protein
LIFQEEIFMNRNIKILSLSGLTVATLTGMGYLAIKRIREKQENEETESEET